MFNRESELLQGNIWGVSVTQIVVASAIVLGAIFLVLILPIGLYMNGWVSPQVATLITGGLSALGTLLLAAATLISLFENRRLTELRLKQQERPLREDELRGIVYPSIEKIDENKQKIKSEDFNWIPAEKSYDYDLDPEETEMVYIDLDPIWQEDPVISDRFLSRYPETTELLDKYSRMIIELDKCAGKFIADIRDPMEEFIESEDVKDEDGAPADPDEAINYLLVGNRPNRYNQRPDYWVEYSEEFLQLINEAGAEESYERFSQKRNQVFNFSMK